MLEEQPLWRHRYLKVQKLYKVYKAAPKEIRVDPLYYPTERYREEVEMGTMGSTKSKR